MNSDNMLRPLVGSSYGTQAMFRTTVRAAQRDQSRGPATGFRTCRPLRQPVEVPEAPP